MQLRLFPDIDNGRQVVLEDGTLVIERAQREDAGDYLCEAQSVAGTAYVKAKLEVKGKIQLLHIIGLVAKLLFKLAHNKTK